MKTQINRNTLQANYNRQKGSSLIELAVAILIFASGVLAVAALQGRSVQESFDIGQRNLAVNKSRELADRISMNTSAAANFQNNGPILTAYVNAVNNANLCDGPPDPICVEFNIGGGTQAAAQCNPIETATFDSWNVLCLDGNGIPFNLPAATNNPLQGSVVTLNCLTAGAPSACVNNSPMSINFQWQSRSASANDNRIANANAITTQNFTMGFQP